MARPRKNENYDGDPLIGEKEDDCEERMIDDSMADKPKRGSSPDVGDTVYMVVKATGECPHCGGCGKINREIITNAGPINGPVRCVCKDGKVLTGYKTITVKIAEIVTTKTMTGETVKYLFDFGTDGGFLVKPDHDFFVNKKDAERAEIGEENKLKMKIYYGE